jgi:hypothetical protein
MREYLSHENNSNAALQNIIDLISHDIPGDPRQLIADSLPLSNRSTGLLTRLDQFQDPNV